MKRIEDNLSRKKQGSVKLSYIALCSLSAKNGNSPEIEAYRFEIADFASLSERSVVPSLKILDELKIIEYLGQERDKKTGKFEKMRIFLKKANTKEPVGKFGKVTYRNEIPVSKLDVKLASGGIPKKSPVVSKVSPETVGKLDVELSHIIKKERKIEKKEIYSFFKEREYSPEEKLTLKFLVGNGERYFQLYGETKKSSHGEIVDGWIDIFEKMIRLDKLSFKQIDFILNWLYRLEEFVEVPSKDSDFWRNQILTPPKFRDKQKSSGLKYSAVLMDKIRNEWDSFKKAEAKNLSNKANF